MKTVADVFLDMVYYVHHGEQMSYQSKLIAEYHSSLHDEDQKRLCLTFASKDSSIRCMVSTIAFGIGIDIEDIGLIIHCCSE